MATRNDCQRCKQTLYPGYTRNKTVAYLNNELLELQKDRDYFIQKLEITRDPGDKLITECTVRKA